MVRLNGIEMRKKLNKSVQKYCQDKKNKEKTKVKKNGKVS